MPFKAYLKKIELDAEGVVKPLLGVVRQMVDRDVVPKGKVGCEDCKLLGDIIWDFPFKHLKT